MSRRITIIQGHPDARPERFGHALEQAYAEAARDAGYEVRQVDVARLEFPLVRTVEDWNSAPPAAIAAAQADIAWAEHLVIFFPLWLGAMPALLKGFLEQVFRPGFAISKTTGPAGWKKRLAGRTARVVVTMGMPALVYKLFFGAHALKGLERNILRFCGIGPVHDSVIGMIEGNSARRDKWLRRMRDLGRSGS
jgi:putative NADPH-quinone reductase